MKRRGFLSAILLAPFAPELPAAVLPPFSWHEFPSGPSISLDEIRKRLFSLIDRAIPDRSGTFQTG